MYLLPPDLTNAADRYTAGELFWVLKNGIKMSGMPSMANDGDELLWNTVAFLQKLPGMTDEQYNDLWMVSQAAWLGMNHGAMNMGEPAAPEAGGAAPGQPGQK